jgi:hypothetical protein
LPVPGGLPDLNGLVGGKPGLTGSHDHDGHHGDGPHGDDVKRDNTPNSDQIDDPRPPDHASGEVGKVDLLKSRLLDITRYDATVEDNGQSHADSTVLGLGGSRIVGSSADSRNHHQSGDNGDALKLCNASGGLLCLSLLYHNTVATEDHDNSLAAARGGVAALCLLNKGRDHKDVTASYECNGLLSLGVAEGLGIAERDKEHGHTKADSANELLNLCIGKRDKLTTPCEGLGVEAVHSDSRSRSDKPDTDRHSFLLGIDSNGKSTYLLDAPFGLALPDHCGDSAILCLLLNQGKSIIFHNPKGAGSAQEALRLDVLNRVLLWSSASPRPSRTRPMRAKITTTRASTAKTTATRAKSTASTAKTTATRAKSTATARTTVAAPSWLRPVPMLPDCWPVDSCSPDWAR